jgi:transposase
MMELIKSSDSIQANCQLITSIKGVAMINTVAILIATQNFTRIENSRQFACYAGLAPFGSLVWEYHKNQSSCEPVGG